MEKNTTKTEVREKIQELLKTLKAEQEKKPLRLVEQLGYLMYVRLFIESQKRVSLQESFPFADSQWNGYRERKKWRMVSAAGSCSIRYSTVLPWWSRDILWKLQDWKKTVCG